MNSVKIFVLLAALIAGAALISSMQGGQPAPPPVEPITKTPPLTSGNRELERADKIDEKMFPDGLVHDFGTVQRGAKLYHAFRVVNTSSVPLRFSSIRTSMSPLSVWSSKEMLQPNEEGNLEVVMDTSRFINKRTYAIFVTLDNGRIKEHRLLVQANSRDDLGFFPDRIDFGKITRGDTPTKNMIVAVPDQPKLQVKAATCENKFIAVRLEELDRGKTRAFYQVSATVRADIPEGKLYETVELSTNNPDMPKLRVPVWVEVEAAK